MTFQVFAKRLKPLFKSLKIINIYEIIIYLIANFLY